MSAALARQAESGANPAHGTVAGATLTDQQFSRVTELLESRTGIAMGPDKVTLVNSRLQKRLRALKMTNYRQYCDLLDSPEGQAEQVNLVNALTTNLTSFFREQHHFKHLVEKSLSPMLSDIRSGRRVRIWSSGCSTGEEPYCIAMMVLSLCPDAAERNVRILATDIDSAVLQYAHIGEYPSNRMQGVPDALKNSFFQQDSDGSADIYRVAEKVRRMITFRKLNLNASTWPMKNKFDIIFCRNTVIYFDEARQIKIWERYRDILQPGGHLYLGHSERLSGPAEKAFDRVGVTVFRKTG